MSCRLLRSLQAKASRFDRTITSFGLSRSPPAARNSCASPSTSFTHALLRSVIFNRSTSFAMERRHSCPSKAGLVVSHQDCFSTSDRKSFVRNVIVTVGTALSNVAVHPR